MIGLRGGAERGLTGLQRPWSCGVFGWSTAAVSGHIRVKSVSDFT